MELSVLKQDGSSTGRTVELDPTVFEAAQSEHAVWLDVRSIQANGRQGTSKSKTRSEVRGGGRKPWRQKGTGRARHGSIRSPHWQGGGTVFGPSPKNHSVKLTHKTKQKARRSALSDKAEKDAIRVVEDFEMDEPKTREVASLLKLLELEGQKVLILTAEHAPNIYKSGRNIPKVSTKLAEEVSTYEVLNADVLLIQEGGLEKLTGRLKGSPAKEEA